MNVSNISNTVSFHLYFPMRKLKAKKNYLSDVCMLTLPRISFAFDPSYKIESLAFFKCAC